MYLLLDWGRQFWWLVVCCGPAVNLETLLQCIKQIATWLACFWLHRETQKCENAWGSELTQPQPHITLTLKFCIHLISWLQFDHFQAFLRVLNARTLFLNLLLSQAARKRYHDIWTIPKVKERIFWGKCFYLSEGNPYRFHNKINNLIRQYLHVHFG